MMEFFQVTGKLLMIPSVVILLYDLCYFWFVRNMIKVQSSYDWVKKIAPGLSANFHTLMLKMGPTGAKIETAPAFLVFLAPGLFFYLLYRLVFVLQGGKAGGYKSRH
ncbi:MAG TPA: hypothetical protein VEF76_13635 [Patescibacteria group bacterium]|nr:hypothetical protein [Patescibacteria group bacterium]